MIRNIFFITTSILIFSSCGIAPQDKSTTSGSKENTAVQTPVEVKYSKCFAIDTITGGFQRLIAHNPADQLLEKHTYILVPKGVAYQAQGDEEIISTPISSCGLLSSSLLGAFDALDIIETIATVESKNYIYNEKVQQLIDAGQVLEVRTGGIINAEKVIVQNPEILFTAGLGLGIDEELKPILNAGIGIIQCYDWREDHPLARAEWIKFFGALFDKEHQADSVFNAIEQSYNAQVALISNVKFENLPKALLSNMFQDTWYMPGGESYIAKLLNDARATYPWSSEKMNGSIPLSFESIAAKSLDSDIWINAEAASLDQLIAKDARLQQFIENAHLGVYHYAKKTNELGGNDYFESGALRADLVLSDYIKMLHPGLKENVDFNYFVELK
jgi:iron complex transport system substrate-binding protein